MLLATPKKLNEDKFSNVIYHRVTINATAEKIFNTLTISDIIDDWGGGPSRVELKLNGAYTLWDGESTGTIREIQQPSHLLHTMRLMKSWQTDWQDSLVTWTLVQNEKNTTLFLRNSCLPNLKIREKISEHWIENFLGPLKAYLDNLDKPKRKRRR